MGKSTMDGSGTSPTPPSAHSSCGSQRRRCGARGHRWCAAYYPTGRGWSWAQWVGLDWVPDCQFRLPVWGWQQDEHPSILSTSHFLVWGYHPQRNYLTTLTIASAGLGRGRRELFMPSVFFFLALVMFFLRLQAGQGSSPPSAGEAGRELFTCFDSFLGKYTLDTSIRSMDTHSSRRLLTARIEDSDCTKILPVYVCTTQHACTQLTVNIVHIIPPLPLHRLLAEDLCCR